MKKIIILVLIIVLGLVLLTRNREDDEFFTSYFNKMVETGESKNLEQFMNFFSLQYKDEYGFNYIVIRNIAENTFNEFDSLKGSFTGLNPKIEKSDGKNVAIINMDAKVIGVKNSIDTGILGLDDKSENITIYLEKSHLGKWKIVKVEGVEKKGY